MCCNGKFSDQLDKDESLFNVIDFDELIQRGTTLEENDKAHTLSDSKRVVKSEIPSTLCANTHILKKRKFDNYDVYPPTKKSITNSNKNSTSLQKYHSSSKHECPSELNGIKNVEMNTSFHQNNSEDIFSSSICLEKEQNISDNFFNEMKLSIIDYNRCTMMEQNKSDKCAKQSLETTKTVVSEDQSQDSFILTNMSFGSAMKRALLANALNSVDGFFDTNMTFTCTQTAVYKKLGTFYGLPDKVMQLLHFHKGIEKLYDWQDECLKLSAIEERKNLIYALPTSGGKTLVAEILMMREILCYERNVLFILPFVAIVQEKASALSPFAVELDFLVEQYAANKGNYPPRKRRNKHSIYIATIEKALGLINSLIELNRINELGLIVVDELHLLGESGRGATLESILSKLLFLKANVQIIGMSATIGNIKDLCDFLQADVYTQNFRPVELIEYVKCDTDIFKINSIAEEELFTFVRATVASPTSGSKSIDKDNIGALVMEVIPKDSCLIFCPTKKNCENVATLLTKVIDRDLIQNKCAEKQRILQDLKEECGSLCPILRSCIPFGIAYHHSGLTTGERRLIEDAFRSGVLSVICCTSTLAAGVNLPAKRVILRQPYVGRDFITLARYKQMVGRAGRAGLGEIGESFLMCSSPDLMKVRELLGAPMDRVVSNLHQADGKELRHLLLSCVSLGIANTRTELQKVASKTLAFTQQNQLNIELKSLTDTAIRNLFKMGALQESDLSKPENDITSDVSLIMNTSATQGAIENNEEIRSKKKRKIVIKSDTRLVISMLGNAAIKANLELSRAHLLYNDLRQAQKGVVLLDALHLLYLVTPYDIAEQITICKLDYYNIYCKLKPSELQTAHILGITDYVAIRLLSNQQIKSISQRVLNRFYLTLILYDLWNGAPVFETAEKYQVNRGIVQNLMTTAASFTSNVISFCDSLNEFWSFGYLLKGVGERLSHCCVKELVPLMELPAVKQCRAKQLYNAGYKNLQGIAKASVDDLINNIEYLSRRMATQLISAARMLLMEKVENLKEEAANLLREEKVDTT